ncbi:MULTISPECIES: NTP/NDP exchange transporter [Helicobacter]|uniref:MFS transporter n=1 Tax=Helicobacter japonicus TaxID=425400 RepID=A0A099BBD6_9HELI|nr:MULTISPECIES: MFS transporter [Helicobacter]TLE02905.1 MFS transporter [Helicobacter japonicus]
MCLFYRIFSLKQEELKLLLYSFLFIFMLFSSYAILRPLRDALGLEGGQEELKWLFLATFILALFCSLALMFVASKIKKKFYIDVVLIFFAFNLLLFYAAMTHFKPNTTAFLWLCKIFYVWVSIFNLCVFSTAWSLLADILNKDMSKRLFGIISAGASLGSIVGAASVGILASYLEVSSLIFGSILLFIGAIVLKNMMIKEAGLHLHIQEHFLTKFNQPIGAKNPFIGFKLIVQSKYLLMLCAFIVLLTSVSTFLYMEQMRIVKEVFPTREARTAAFALIDVIVQSFSLIIQIFFTAKITQFFGIKMLLSTLGFLMCVGFIILSFTHPAFLPLAIVMSIRRIGEYSLVKPGREMLFVPLDADSKYKVKNFLDTVVYRGGDALSAQVEGLLASVGIMCVLLIGALLSFIWGICGGILAKHYEENKFE